ncbi:MAG: response regulator transcription factor [Alistipes sp.]|nr:response regulator transcription factor [Alistipes sp.]
MNRYKVLIIEDELPAQANLQRALSKYCPDLEVVGIRSSVQGSVEWLRAPENQADIIFMDVELEDGHCFDIFSQVEVRSKVVITTAYDNYAVKAFRFNSVDYLLKPIDPEQLQAAVERCRTSLTTQPNAPFDINALRTALHSDNPISYKKRFVVKYGDRLTIIDVAQVAYIYAEDKSTHLVTSEQRRYILDSSLDTVSEELDPNRFFRISRNCTVAVDAIAGISKHPSNRLKVSLQPKPDFEVFVSRARTNDFLLWLEGK